MKGIILAGGLGTRLHPLTKVTNKHLLPVYDKPMIYYPIRTLINGGIQDILIVTGGNDAGDFLRLSLAEFFADKENICVVLGDNIIENNIREAVEAFQRQQRGAKIMLKEVPDPQRFGVPVLDGDRVVRIEEKPKEPKSTYAIIGIYMYDNTVFDIIKTLKPSDRGELEITDVNNVYIDRGEMTWDILDGWWTDAGTFESLLKASQLVAQTGANKKI
jgi:glucose-1-phosphate thymidylyltransferase